MSHTPILLIGPMATGKSTVADELAKLSGIRRVPMDRVRWQYYFKDGYSLEHEQALTTFQEKIAYWKPFEVKAVQRIVTEFPNAIIDFGAGHSYFPDPTQFKEVEDALAPIPDIFLPLPSHDPVRSLEICNSRLLARKGKPLSSDEIEANRAFIQHDSNTRLAKTIVYTENKTPTEIAQEIWNQLQA